MKTGKLGTPLASRAESQPRSSVVGFTAGHSAMEENCLIWAYSAVPQWKKKSRSVGDTAALLFPTYLPDGIVSSFATLAPGVEALPQF